MYYLSIDQGGSSSRVLICDQYGQVIKQAQVAVTTQRNGAFIEQEPCEIVQSIKNCISDCCATLSSKQLAQLSAACLVTQRSSLIAIDTLTNQPITNVISWQDTRGQDYLAELNIDQTWLYKITGLRASAHYGASKMLWCLKNDSKVQVAAKKNSLMFMPIAAYLAACLTNNKSYCVDPTNATRTLLFAARNKGSAINHKHITENELDWHSELLSLFSIKKQWLPKILPSNSMFGNIDIGDYKIPLKYVNGDQSAALFAYGQPKTNEIYLNIGTGAFISRLVDSVESIDAGLLHSVINVECSENINRYNYALEGTVNGAGVALELMAKELGIAAADVDLLATAQQPIPIFINTIAGLGAPFWQSDIPSQFIGKGSPHTKMIAVFESIVFLIVTIINRMAVISPSINRLIASGGLANHNGLCQLIVDLSGVALIRKGQTEASALGGVWLLAGEPEQWLVELEQQQFLVRENAELNARFEQWSKVMNNLNSG